MENQEIQDNQDTEDFSEASVPLQKEKKEKKPRSQKQLDHFKNMAEKRRENIEKKKLEKKIEASKLLLEHDIKSTPTKPKKEVAVKEETEEVESEPSSEEEIIIKKKTLPCHRQVSRGQSPQPKAKGKKKKIVIYEEDSSDSDSDDEIPIPKKQFKTQQNKKSIVKVYQNETVVNKSLPKINYFAD